MGCCWRSAGPIHVPVLLLSAPPVLPAWLVLPAGLVLAAGLAGLARPARGPGRGNDRAALAGGPCRTR